MFEIVSQLSRNTSLNDDINKIAPMKHYPTTQTTQTIQSDKHVCKFTPCEYDVQIVGIRSTIPLESMIITFAERQILSFPLHVMPYKNWNFTFPYPVSLLGKMNQHYVITFVPQNPKDKGQMEITLNETNFDTNQILLPQVRFDYDAVIKEGISRIDTSLVNHPCIGILMDVDNIEDIGFVQLSLERHTKTNLRLFPLSKKTIYASIDQQPFPFHQGKEGINFTKMPNLSRFSHIELEIASVKEQKARFRFITANILLRSNGIVGVKYM